MGEHAEMAYSHSEVFFGCAASFQEEARWPPFRGNKYTEQGTAAHALGEALILGLPEPKEGAELLDADDRAAVQVYANYAQQLQAQGYELAVEQRVAYGSEDLGAFGTVDLVAWHPGEKSLIVCDYKHGAGVAVAAEGNLQLLSYLCSVLDTKKYQPEHMWLVVVQPRCRGKAVKEWAVPWDLLAEHAALMFTKREAAKAANPDYNMGEHCRWCRALQGCPEVQRWLSGAMELDLTQVKELQNALEFIDVVEPWIKAVQAAAYAHLESGGTIEGWGLYPKQGRRAWRDQAAVGEYLLRRGADPEDIHSVQLLSPAQMQKVVTKEMWQEVAKTLVETRSSGLKLDRVEKHKGQEPVAQNPGEQLAVAAKRLMAARLTSGS